MQRLLNPPGSAYRSETGGLMEALRVLTVEQSTISFSLFFEYRMPYLIISRCSPKLSQEILRSSQSVAHRDRETLQRDVFPSESNPRTDRA